MKISIIHFVSMLLCSLSFAQQSEVGSLSSNQCFSREFIVEMAEDFEQLRDFSSRNLSQFCEVDLGPNWHSILNVLKLIKEFDQQRPQITGFDDLTKTHIQIESLWDYFKDRADRFDLTPSHCGENFIAYVWHEIPGEINLCERFYSLSVPEKAAQLLHEVRHFDGFHHVTCTRGSNKGVQYGCDERIEDLASYTVTVQALVEMALYSGPLLSDEERLEAGAQALAYAHDGFNELPVVDVDLGLYLSSEDGEISRWTMNLPEGSPTKISLFKKLVGATFIIAWFNQLLDLFPMDTEAPSTSLLNGKEFQELSAFGEAYNQLTPAERSKVKVISYNSNILVIDQNVFMLCDADSTLSVPSPLPEPIRGVFYRSDSFSLRHDDFVPNHGIKDYLIGASGSLYEVRCQVNGEYPPYIERLNSKVAPGLIKIVYYADQYMGLTDQGHVVKIQKIDEEYIGSPVRVPEVDAKLWVDIEPYFDYTFFNMRNVSGG